MVNGYQQDGYLVVTWANWHYQDFVMTWVMHVKKVGITGYIVGAMDDHLLEASVTWTSGLGAEEDRRWGGGPPLPSLSRDDDDALCPQVMIEKKINCFSMKSGLTLGDFGWGSATFAKMGREKIRLIGEKGPSLSGDGLGFRV